MLNTKILYLMISFIQILKISSLNKNLVSLENVLSLQINLRVFSIHSLNFITCYFPAGTLALKSGCSF